MRRGLLVTVALLASATTVRAQAPAEGESREILARAFLPMTQLYVDVEFVGSAEALGLSQDSIAARAREHLQATLPELAVRTGTILIRPGFEEQEPMLDTGQIRLRVWTVGEENPIAYHVAIHAGPILALRLYESQVLGYSGRNRFPADLDGVIEGLVREFATTFMSVRGEL